MTDPVPEVAAGTAQEPRWQQLRATLLKWGEEFVLRPQMMVKTPFETIQRVVLEMDRLAALPSVSPSPCAGTAHPCAACAALQRAILGHDVPPWELRPLVALAEAHRSDSLDRDRAEEQVAAALPARLYVECGLVFGRRRDRHLVGFYTKGRSIVNANHRHEWRLCEELRPQVPESVFRWLCIGSSAIFGTRQWMAMQPFRWLLFRKVNELHD